MRQLGIAAIVGFLASGCVVLDDRGICWQRHGLFNVIADDRPSSAADDRAAIERAEETPVYVPPNLQPPRAARAEPARTPFEQVKALAAIHERDISSCAARGAPPGYGHARVTFDGGGHVTAVVVDAPAGMNDDALACVGDEMRSVEVPPFDGAAVTVGASYFVGTRL
jgi:hypothetical protein